MLRLSPTKNDPKSSRPPSVVMELHRVALGERRRDVRASSGTSTPDDAIRDQGGELAAVRGNGPSRGAVAAVLPADPRRIPRRWRWRSRKISIIAVGDQLDAAASPGGTAMGRLREVRAPEEE